MDSVLLANGIEDGSQSVVEEVIVDDVANEVIVEGGNYVEKSRNGGQGPYAAIALRTNDSLKGRPRVYVPAGRTPYAKQGSSEHADEDPPRLSDPDGSYATPSMRAHFRIYADATLRKADHIFQVNGASSSHSQPMPPEDEVTEHENGHQMKNTLETGEDLEHILDESHVLEQQESMNDKTEMFYGTEDEQGIRMVEEYEEWPPYADQPVDFPEACDILLGNTQVPDSKVCKTVPNGISRMGTWIVNWCRGDQQEINMDGLGSWGKPSGRTRFYQMDHTKNKYVCVSDARGQLLQDAEYDVKCQLRKYEHPTTTLIGGGTNRFIKKIISSVGKDGQPFSSFSIIAYEWVGTPFDFTYSNEARPARSLPPPPPEGARNWEEASLQACDFGAFPPTCSAMMGGCPMYSGGAIQFGDVCNIIMGATLVHHSLICDRIPQQFRECGTFVIRVHDLGSEHELRRDDNGQWGKPAGNSRYFKFDGTDVVRLDKSGRISPSTKAQGAYDLQVLCKRYEHPQTGNRFVRKIYTGRTPVDKDFHESSELAVITYFWKGDPTPFDIVPQRKVRIHNASAFEENKRINGVREMREYGDDDMDEVAMMDEMHGEEEGQSIYLEPESALVDDDIQMRMMSPPARKRIKMDGASPITDQQHMRQDMGREMMHDAGGHSNDSDEVRFAKKALENQERFSRLLDRFDSVAAKMERMVDMQANMMWRQQRQYVGEHEQRDRPEGEVQYVEEVVYEDEE